MDFELGESQRCVAIFFHQHVLDVIHEIGGIRIIQEGSRFDNQRFGFGRVAFLFGDHVVIRHLVQHKVAPHQGPVLIAQRRVPVGRGNHPGDRRSFFKREISDVFVEKCIRRFAEAHDAEGTRLAKVHFIAVKLENFSF